MTFHQLLHGYDGGHKLLASSCELPSLVARKILVQSDLSGSIPPKAFETYLTGYPLREISAYAFARTWYAPEMPRPGCVWTHTLLVEAADFDRIGSLSAFLECFKRPQMGEYGDFRNPVQRWASDVVSEKEILQSDCEDLVRLFYSPDPKPIVMGDTEQGTYEAMFLELWAQLWPQARFAFTFSTGSLSARKFDSRPFDLQLSPASSVRDVVRSSGAALAQRVQPTGLVGIDRGIYSLVVDFRTHGLMGLRQFLARIADDSFIRSDARPAALVYELLSEDRGLDHEGADKLLQVVAEGFPESDQAIALKRYCFTAIDQSFIPHVDSWIIVRLATRNYGEAFASPEIGVLERMIRIINQDSTSALELLVELSTQYLTKFGEHVALAIISAQSEWQILSFLRRSPQFVSIFTKVRPSLAAKTEFWTILSSHSHEILEALASSKETSPEQLKEIFSAFFHAQLDQEANYFFSMFGSSALAAFFAHRGSHPRNLRDRWTDSLAARPDLVENFLQNTDAFTPETLAGIAATYSPIRAASIMFPLGKWLQALRVWRPDFSPYLGSTVETCSFSLALSFRLKGDLAAELCQLSFQNVYAAAAEQTMPYSAWSMLEPHVPHISLFRDWDRCERLRRALVQCFVNNQWPIHFFVETLHNSKTRREFVKTARNFPEVRKLLYYID